MCGRYSVVCIDDLGNRFRVHNPMIGARSKFNVTPGCEMPVIVRREKNEVALMCWGLVPPYAGALKPRQRQINARAETLVEKSLSSPLLVSGRCLVPASGFYEWKREGNRRIPFYFSLPESPLFAFAGLYSATGNQGDSSPGTFMIITCRSNSLVAPIHHRMPVILQREEEDRWLSGNPLTQDELERILAPHRVPAIARAPVSDLVNNPSLDDERLVQPLGSLSPMQTLLPE